MHGCADLIDVALRPAIRFRGISSAHLKDRTMKSLVDMAVEGQKISTSSVFFFGIIGLVFFIVGICFLVATKNISTALQDRTPQVSYGPGARAGFPSTGFVRAFGAIFSTVGVGVLAFAAYQMIG